MGIPSWDRVNSRGGRRSIRVTEDGGQDRPAQRMQDDANQLKRYQQWLYSRIPLIAKRRWRKAAQALVEEGSPAAVQVLAEAVARRDNARARQVMVQALRQLTDQSGIDAVCTVWAATHHTALADVLTEQ